MRGWQNWMNERTGYRALLAPIVRRVLPAGPRWAYGIAACLLWLLVVQIVTGFFMMAQYSPSMRDAWASVHYLEHSGTGALLRGVHYYSTQVMIVLLLIHIARVFLTAAFRAPRELIWVTGLFLFPLILVWSITGNPLTGSQTGLSQIEVEGRILGSTPWIGPPLERILIGGSRVGQLTLSHLYALHVGLLPLVAFLLLGLHISQVYRYGLSIPATADRSKARPYWPYQTVRNMTVVAIVLGGIALWAWRVGAPLGFPADGDFAHSPRPEWYFRWLFELRRYFTGDWEFIATIVIPAAVMLLLVAFPLIDRAFTGRANKTARWLAMGGGLGIWLALTAASLWRDHHDVEYQASLVQLEELSQRARDLADRGVIPPTGAASLLQQDARVQGPRLFARHCASCHSHADADGVGIVASEPSAPNLYGFARPEWVSGWLDPQRIGGPHYLGNTAMASGEMVSAMQSLHETAMGSGDPEELTKLRAQWDQVAETLSAEATLPGATPTSGHAERVAVGASLIQDGLGCVECHKFHEHGELGTAPDLTGYGSRDWLIAFLRDPRHERFYAGDHNDRMPSFAPSVEHPEQNRLTLQQLELISDWLRRDWYEPSSEPRSGSHVFTHAAD